MQNHAGHYRTGWPGTEIIKDAVEHVLGMEMEDFILQEKEKGSSVTRNGTTHKNIKTAYGNIGIQVPRTREARV